jgi:opacity protein-like surface antigen
MFKACPMAAAGVLLVAAVSLSIPALAADHPTLDSTEWNLALDGQYRARAQFDSGKDFLGDKVMDREWISHRARLGAVAGKKNGPQLVLRLQDTRVWGEEDEALGQGTLAGSAKGLDLHEAHAVVPLGVAGLTLKAGRQEILLDNQRLVGNLDWTMRGRSFDAARLQYAANGLDVSLLASMINERDAVDADGHVPALRKGDIYFGGLHARHAVNADHRVSVLALSRKNDSAEATGNELRHTLGAYAEGKQAGISYNAEGYYQLGHQGAADIDAWMAGLRVAYAVPLPMAPTVTVWFEDLSGDGNAAHAFDTLYATNHKFYGEVDMFLNIPKHTNNRGLRDIAGAVSCTPMAGLSAGVDFHLFADHELDGAALTAAKGAQTSTDLGKEVDVRVLWKINPGLGLHALYGVFLPGEGMRALRKIAAGTDMTNEHYGALTLDTWF